MNGHTLIDLRHLDAPKPEPEFLPADPMDVKTAREAVTHMRIERMAEGYHKERERDGRPL